MTNKVLEKIMRLASDGYEIRILPDYIEGCYELRLSKNYHHVARIVDPQACRQSRVWNSDEEWFLYILDNLVQQYEDYVAKVLKGEKYG